MLGSLEESTPNTERFNSVINMNWRSRRNNAVDEVDCRHYITIKAINRVS